MEFLQKYWYWIAAAVILVGEPWLRKKHPALWWRLQLPSNIVMTLISAVFIALMLRAVWLMVTSDILPILDRFIWPAFGLAAVVVFAFCNIRAWRDWRREKKRREEESSL